MLSKVIDNSISDIDIGKPEYWLYKGEGAMNVVLSYNGPSNDDLNGLVLRVKKLSNGGSNLEKEIELYDFVLGVMSPLLGEKYVFPGKMIKITKEFLESLDNIIFSKRPIKRSTTRLDTDLTVAFLIMDLTRLDNNNTIDHHHVDVNTSNSKGSKVICIEIKPKWGFSPKPHLYLNKEYEDIKLSKCRYCMHQELKFKDGSIGDKVSNYCPIDLFCISDIGRQKSAIINLINHPQNNLKVYCDGKLSFTGSLGGGIERNNNQNFKILSNLLIDNKIILKNNSGDEEEEEEEKEGKDNINLLSIIITSILQRETILENIKKVQEYDQFDIEGIYYLYNKLYNNGIGNDRNEDFSELDKLSNEEAKEAINKFMISCTAKDCSIMISFTVDKPINNINNSNIQFNYINTMNGGGGGTGIGSNITNIQYKIGVVDLDTKKQSAIPKYYKLDQEILKIYKSTLLADNDKNNNTKPSCK